MGWYVFPAYLIALVGGVRLGLTCVIEDGSRRPRIRGGGVGV